MYFLPDVWTTKARWVSSYPTCPQKSWWNGNIPHLFPLFFSHNSIPPKGKDDQSASIFHPFSSSLHEEAVIARWFLDVRSNALWHSVLCPQQLIVTRCKKAESQTENLSDMCAFTLVGFWKNEDKFLQVVFMVICS